MVGGLCAALPLAAQAQLASQSAPNEPVYVGTSVAFNHDSNIFRASQSQASQADTSATSSLLGGFDLRPGRQRLYGKGSVSKVEFRHLSQLDHVAYALNAGLDWETVNNISGKLDIVRNRGLADYGGDGDPRLFVKNLETSQQLTAVARVGVVTRLTVEAQWQRRDVAYSAQAFEFREFSQDAASVNARYKFSDVLSVAGGLRYTEGEFPTYARRADGSASADDYVRRDVDLLVDWTPTGKSMFSGRLSVGDQSSSQATRNDFSGVTGALTWTYQATGKLQFVSVLVRDTGAESRFVNFGPSETSRTDTSRLSTTAKLAARYDATSKIQFMGSVLYSHRSLTDSVRQTGTASGGASGTDNLSRLELGVRYLPLRTVALQCNLASERRRTDTTLSYPYTVNTAGCIAELRLNIL